MSDFITRLAQRQLGQLATVEPRLPSVFAAPANQSPLAVFSEALTVESPPRHGAESVSSRAEPAPLVQDAGEPERTAHRPKATEASFVRRAPAPGEIPRLLRAGDHSIEPPPMAHSIAAKMAARGTEAAAPLRADSEPQALERAPMAPQSAAPAAAALNDPVRRAAARAESVPPPLAKVTALAPPAAPARLATPNRAGAAALTDTHTAGAEAPIHVSIGRIEVTALTQALPAQRTAAPRKPAMSLDDYLARRRRRES